MAIDARTAPEDIVRFCDRARELFAAGQSRKVLDLEEGGPACRYVAHISDGSQSPLEVRRREILIRVDAGQTLEEVARAITPPGPSSRSRSLRFVMYVLQSYQRERDARAELAAAAAREQVARDAPPLSEKTLRERRKKARELERVARLQAKERRERQKRERAAWCDALASELKEKRPRPVKPEPSAPQEGSHGTMPAPLKD